MENPLASLQIPVISGLKWVLLLIAISRYVIVKYFQKTEQNDWFIPQGPLKNVCGLNLTW